MANYLGYIFSVLGGGLAGSILTLIVTYYRNRLQIMNCHYLEDDILSKIPQVNEENEVQSNLHCKKFLIKNTTNIDLIAFQVVFQFDHESVVTECYSRSKEGYDIHKIKADEINRNQASSTIRNFNRGDKIEFVIKVANVTENKYYVTETGCTGFKIKCKDKRKDTKKSKSSQSNQVLVRQH